MVKKMLPIRKKLTGVDETIKNVSFGIVGPCYINRCIIEMDFVGLVHLDYVKFGLATKELAAEPSPQAAGVIGYDLIGVFHSTNGAFIQDNNRRIIEMYGYPLSEGKELYGFIYTNTDGGGNVNSAMILNWAK